MTFNQLLDFIDNLDTSIKHIVMLYEEPEYAKLVQMRFLNNGLRNGQCCIYAAPDYDDLSLIKMEMAEFGIDVDYHRKRGLLQFHMRKPSISDVESYKRARTSFQNKIENTYFGAQDHDGSTLPKIRGIGSIFRDIFASGMNENPNKAQMAATQLLVEELFQSENADAFEGIWMCAYEVGNIHEAMEESWMSQLLASHDAVLYLPKLSNGLALDTRK